jgi:hypothetical protein
MRMLISEKDGILGCNNVLLCYMLSPVYSNLLGQSALPESDAPQKFNQVPKEGQHEGSWGIISHIRMIRQYSAVRLPRCNNVVHRPMCGNFHYFLFIQSPQVLGGMVRELCLAFALSVVAGMPEMMNKTKDSMFTPPHRQKGVHRS